MGGGSKKQGGGLEKQGGGVRNTRWAGQKKQGGGDFIKFVKLHYLIKMDQI